MLAFLQANPACRTLLVEKTDRLYRNARDWVSIDDLKLTIHFVKENVVLTPDARSSDKFMHGIKVLMAKNYVDNLSEEVKKGLNEKAKQGHWPGVAHVGYVNNRATACSISCYRTAPSIAELSVPPTLSRSIYWSEGTKLEIGERVGFEPNSIFWIL
jgi:DNA invertase Pin-like site-specific DNA recombinase